MKINKNHFNIEEKKLKINQKLTKRYVEIKALPLGELSDKHRMFLEQYEHHEKQMPSKFIITHKKTKISEIIDSNDVDKAILNLITKINQIRKSNREIKPDISRTFDGANYQTTGKVFLKPNSILEIAKNTSKFDPLKPKTPRSPKTNYIGVELEFNDNIGMSYKTLAEKLKEKGYSKYVHVGLDGSCGIEVRVLLPEDDFIKPLTDIMNFIQSFGYTTDSRCGTHVHLDMRNRDVKTCYQNLYKALSLLKKFQTEDRQTNSYCRPNKKATLDLSNPEDRYSAINARAYIEHKTLEIRMHQGTLKPEILIPWIKLLTKIVNNPNVIKATRVTSVLGATRHFNIEKPLADELRTRIKAV